MRRRTSLLLLCLAVLTFCSVSACQSGSQDFEITLRRTACYGTCPVYTVKIKSDGSVTYQGEKYVRVEGAQSTTVARSEVAKLLDEMVAAKYFTFEEDYSEIKHADGTISVVTDLPTTYTTLRMGEKTKTIRDYVGAPEELRKIESRIDEVAGTRKWVFVDGPTVLDLAQHGWDPKSREAERYLVEGAEYGYADVVEALLNIGVNPEAPTARATPLQLARTGAIVKLLAKAGGNVNAKKRGEYGDRPLQYAAHYSQPDAVSALIDAGADLNYADEYGETILMYAVYSGDPKKVELLIAAGAKINQRSKAGMTALDIAKKCLKETQSERYPDVFERPKDFEGIILRLHAVGAE